jgi:hypothetical protein
MKPLRDAVERFDIEEFSSEFVEINKDRGTDLVADCPFCNGHNKLYISKAKRLVHCFKCSSEMCSSEWNGKADLVKWIMLCKGWKRGQAVQHILKSAGIFRKFNYEPEERDISLPRGAIKIVGNCGPDHPCRMFLRSRGLEHKIHDWYMCPLGSGDFQGRIIMPVKYMGRTTGWEAKSFCGQKPKSLSNYLPSTIYSTDLWDRSRKYAVIVEGIFDAETICCNAISIMGSDLSYEKFAHILAIKDWDVDTLIWMLDGDACNKQMKIILEWASMFFSNKFVKLPSYDDPNSMGSIESWNRIHAAESVRSAYDQLTVKGKHHASYS